MFERRVEIKQRCIYRSSIFNRATYLFNKKKKITFLYTNCLLFDWILIVRIKFKKKKKSSTKKFACRYAKIRETRTDGWDVFLGNRRLLERGRKRGIKGGEKADGEGKKVIQGRGENRTRISSYNSSRRGINIRKRWTKEDRSSKTHRASWEPFSYRFIPFSRRNVYIKYFHSRHTISKETGGRRKDKRKKITDFDIKCI